MKTFDLGQLILSIEKSNSVSNDIWDNEVLQLSHFHLNYALYYRRIAVQIVYFYF